MLKSGTMLKTLSMALLGCSLAFGACKKDEAKAAPEPAAAEETAVAETAPAVAEEPAKEAEEAVVDPTKDPEAIAAATTQAEGAIKMCADTADARAKRQAAKPLYERLGGEEPLTAVVTDIVELHATEEITKDLMVGVDKAHLIKMVVDMLGEAMGGPQKYTGKDMVAAHAHLKMNNVHFMKAADQIMRVLAKYKVPEEETQEVVCLIVAHHGDAITE